MINVTKPFLPPIEEYKLEIDKIWEKVWLTNDGPILKELEGKLKKRLGVDHLLYLGNGTIALQIAIKALELSGEIITTPFSYVATTSSIVWENCTPVFVDIEKGTLNMDADLIEAAITENTSAIMATHVFGNACNIEKIGKIAKKYKLKVIYDAAHCFGTLYKGKSILDYGDISTISFHATKLFHTTEGGAVTCNSDELAFKMSKLRNFGHNGPEEFYGAGINGKNSEFHAAMGLVNLKYIDEVLNKRKAQYLFYKELLSDSNLTFLEIEKNTDFNYSYFPVIFSNQEELLQTMQNLNKHNIFPRRYFYPSLNTLDYVKGELCPISEDISSRVMTLPLFHDLSNADIKRICTLVKDSI